MTLTKDFEFGESQGTSVGIAFDGDPKPWYSALKKKAWLLSRSGTFYFSNLVTYCAASSSWKQTDFMFRGLDISNDSFLKLYRNDADYIISGIDKHTDSVRSAKGTRPNTVDNSTDGCRKFINSTTLSEEAAESSRRGL